MSRVITFSREFPSYHPRKGQATNFVEQIWNSIGIPFPEPQTVVDLENINTTELGIPALYEFINNIKIGVKEKKHHTIRAGNRWKVGDKFSPRVWSGKPYQSKQITIASDIEVKKMWYFEMDINGQYSINGSYFDDFYNANLALNDGLSEVDMFYWLMPDFNKPKSFKGQIICWNEDIQY